MTAEALHQDDDRPGRVMFRGRGMAEVDAKLRAIYRHQLHRPGGIEGWSEWGRAVLEDAIARYENEHGDVGESTEPLKRGRPAIS